MTPLEAIEKAAREATQRGGSKRTILIPVGSRFGRLTVTSRTEAKAGQATWLCRCDCGREVAVQGGALRRGHTSSCGCLRLEQLHGGSRGGRARRNECRSWRAMIRRCTVPTQDGYANYGGRGISVCQRWLDSFDAFYADMGKRPSRAYSIDRINVDGNYEPGNCRWATMKEQAANKRATLSAPVTPTEKLREGDTGR
jgi:hypothetical protein